MTRTLTLLLSDGGLAHVDQPWRRIDPADPHALAQFARVTARAGLPLRLLIDVRDETLIAEPLPRLGRRDRQALLQRRLAQHDPAAAHRHAGLFQGAALYSALPATTPLDAVLDALADAGAVMLGAWSLPRLALSLADVSDAHRLLLWPGPDGALRQALFVAGQLQLCRLDDSHPSSPAAERLADAIAHQAQLALRHLAGHGHRADSLAVQILAPHGSASRIADDVRARAIDELCITALPLPAGHTLASYWARRLEADAPPHHYGTRRQLKRGCWLRRLHLARRLGLGLLLGATVYASHALATAQSLDSDTALHRARGVAVEQWLAAQQPSAEVRAALAEPQLARLRQLDRAHLADRPDPLELTQRLSLAWPLAASAILSRHAWQITADGRSVALELAGTAVAAPTPADVASLTRALDASATVSGDDRSFQLRLTIPRPRP
ncbi:hypothetical protein GCM10007860_13780 [Chitiniphilus shinanonensis]|uniref:GspL cytoplasmic actin-ATPase-like domain-containing protein n=1 Tax=Chitiniphilus shinanonensis TaxID=553088 RepID=A0ABQ6BS92_9NEIS|nr:hypothetical protein [Chitiniphilus shinanonensis]GLS04232.1 hypothetical protein GCM10007860_13780 [Chitiniphilus shinanonensis]